MEIWDLWSEDHLLLHREMLDKACKQNVFGYQHCPLSVQVRRMVKCLIVHDTLHICVRVEQRDEYGRAAYKESIWEKSLRETKVGNV